MSHTLQKTTSYKELLSQIEYVIQDETNEIANLANIVAILKENYDFFWVGFYLVDNHNEYLVLAPFQGTLACTRIKKSQGVCGTAWKQNQTQLVTDVNQLEGHLVCSSKSQSEIVIPLRVNGTIVGVLDIDSDRLNYFSDDDKQGLEDICKTVELMIKRCRNI